MAKIVRLSQVVGGGYSEFWKDQRRYECIKGGRASKKSKTAALRMIFRLMKYPKSNALIVRRTFATLRDSCYSDLKWATERLGVEHLWKFSVSPLEVTYLPTGQKILFRGMDNALKITSISVPHGVLCFVWIEEAYEVTGEDSFNKLDMSIRGEVPEGHFKQVTLTLNPWSEAWWGKKRFFDTPSDNVFTLTTTYRCNEWLDDTDRRLFEEMKKTNPRRYRVEGLGEWGISEGVIYQRVEQQGFDWKKLVAARDEELKRKAGMWGKIAERDRLRLIAGVDFGYTDPTAYVVLLIDEREQTIYVVDEIYKTNVTNQMLADQIIRRNWGGLRLICDSAEPKSIQELRDQGLKAEGASKGRDSVLFGIQKLQNFRWVVHPRCGSFWRDITSYAWAKTPSGKFKDQPDHEFSHGPDAARYAAMKLLNGSGMSFD